MLSTTSNHNQSLEHNTYRNQIPELEQEVAVQDYEDSSQFKNSECSQSQEQMVFDHTHQTIFESSADKSSLTKPISNENFRWPTQ